MLIDAQMELLPLTVQERIEAAMAGPCMFFFVREAASILALTEAQVRWAVRWYRLDSLLVGNQYRIPRSALSRFWTDRHMITRQRIGYEAYVQRQELGQSAILPSVHPSLSCDAFRSDDRPEALEMDPMDWYDLWELPFPCEATVTEWSRLLRSPTACLTKDLRTAPDAVLGWPDIYDWMISREMVNLPVSAAEDAEEATKPRKSDPVPPSW